MYRFSSFVFVFSIAFTADLRNFVNGEEPEIRIDKITGHFYEVGQHCHENMIFYAEANNTEFGQCDCINEPPAIYHKLTSKCYHLYTRAYCDPYYWLVLDHEFERFSPICALNPCNDEVKTHRVVSYNDKCVLLGDPSSECKPGEIIYFKEGEFHPSCVVEYEMKKSFQLVCRKGNRIDYENNCRNITDIPYKPITYTE